MMQYDEIFGQGSSYEKFAIDTPSNLADSTMQEQVNK
jgi:hypothetical protein